VRLKEAGFWHETKRRLPGTHPGAGFPKRIRDGRELFFFTGALVQRRGGGAWEASLGVRDRPVE
jgi:hypothetical protein